MSLPHAALSSLQAAGAAVYAADAELKKTAQEIGEQVKQAMLQNPFDLSNDSLFESWKILARLSGALAQVETEFRKIYTAASDLSGGALPTLAPPALGGPSSTLDVVNEMQATDVVAKKTRKASKGRKARAAKPKTAAPKGDKPVRGNAAQLLAYLQQNLVGDDFAKVNWSNVAVETGIAKGSIGAARIKLLETGHLAEGPANTFKLTAASV